MKRYRLLKDLPDLKAGAVFVIKEGNLFRPETEMVGTYSFWQQTIMDNPDWFEEIKEKSDVEVLAEWLCNQFTSDVSSCTKIQLVSEAGGMPDNFKSLSEELVDRGFDVGRIR